MACTVILIKTMDNVITALIIVFGLNGALGLVLALNAFGSSQWVARSYANIPRGLRLPGQDKPNYYRVVGAVMLTITVVIFVWIATRLTIGR